MKKIIISGVAILAGLAVVSESAMAQEAQRPRRKGFFESLFGVRTKPQREVVVEKQWWQDDPGQIRIIRPPKRVNNDKAIAKKLALAKKPVPVKTAYIDPEVSEGLGMGNIVYTLPKLSALYDSSLRNAMTIDPETSALRAVLTDKTTDIRASETVRSAVLEFYKSTGFKPLWSKQGVLSPRALATLTQLSKASEDGLEPLRYKPAGLSSFEVSDTQFEGDVVGAAHFDVSLTVAALTFALHNSGGAFEPERLSAYNDVTPAVVAPAVALKVLAYSPFPADYLKSLVPNHAAYVAMKAELASLPVVEETDAMAEGKRIRIGQKDPRVAQLRAMLIKLDYLGQAGGEVDFDKEDVLDKTLAKALKSYQAAQGIPQTSNLDTPTVRAINGPDLSERRELLLTNMERMRWLPKQLGERHVFVNQASYRVNVMENGQSIWASNVIVGKALNQTNVFSDTMETVVLNPSWGMPESILLNEFLPKLRANPGYLDKIGYKVVNASGKVVSSRSINWSSVGTGSGLGVQQPPGDGNALGKVKFLFPNKHSIYMHDTPNRNLFAESKRNFSHGCVRVENPLEFASVLLKLDLATIAEDIETGESKAIKIETPTKVHLTYFTAWPDQDGKLQYYSDAYGRDATLREARKTTAKMLGLNDAQQLSEKSE